jgi:hypothetical protein
MHTRVAIVVLLGSMAVTASCGSRAAQLTTGNPPTPTDSLSSAPHTAIGIKSAPPICSPPSGTIPVLRLSDRAPQPRITINAGQTVEVVARFGPTKVKLPSATQGSADVHTTSLRHCPDGSSVGLFRASHPGLVFFSSSYQVATATMDPSLGGYVRIHPTYGG